MDNKRPQLAMRSFIFALLWVGSWVGASETLRYFAFVMPMTRKTFSMVPGVAPMNVGVFGVWTIWMVILTTSLIFTYWLTVSRIGASIKASVVAGALVWTTFFVLFWLGAINMGLGTWQIAAIALPWAFVECVVACLIARWSLRSS